MDDSEKSKEQLIQELEDLRRRNAELEKAETERLRAEEALRESEEHYKNFFNNALVGLFRSRLSDGLFLEINSKAAEQQGLPIEDIVGKVRSADLYRYADQRKELIKKLKRDGEVHDFEADLTLHDGRNVTYSISVRAYPDRDYMEGAIIDITDRRKTLNALKDSEEKYRILVDNAGEAIFVVQDEHVKFANQKATGITSYTLKELTSGRFADLIHTDDWPKIREKQIQSLKGLDPSFGQEFRLVRKSSEIRLIELKVVLIEWEGSPATLNFVTDITERKQIENALKESEKRYRNLYNNAEVGLFETRLSDGKVISCNRRCAELSGYDDIDKFMEEYVVSEHYTDPDVRHRMVEELKRTGAVENFEAEITDRLGNSHWWSFSAKLNTDRDLIEGVLVNITERKRAEEALRESEKRYRDLFENATMAIFRSTLDGKAVTVNPMFARMFGYASPEEFLILVNNVSTDVFADPGRRSEIIRLKTENPELNTFENLYRRKDGSTFLGRLNVRSIMDGEGNVIFYEGFIEDITERRQAEEEKRKLADQLQRAERMEALGTLAGGVAHDLNNVLGIIVGFSELLLYDVEESSPLRPGLINILSGSQKAAAIVQDLLTLARRGVANRTVVNLNRVILESQNSPEFEKLKAQHPAVKIRTELEPALLNTAGSTVHLSKALFNLISNANEAMPNGGTLTIKTSNQYLDRPIQGYDEIREGDYVIISVSDTGEGIPASDLKRIFEPFYTKKVMGRSGTGLGLAVVWGTVKDHQGYINVQSLEGKGSTFTLYFPVTREEITPKEVTISLSEYQGKGETILIVDDVKGQRDLAKEMLKKLNYNATSVSSGEEAVVYLKEHKVDLLVLDMIMDSGIDGLDTYQRILEIHPQQKAIIVSGFSETDRVNTAQSLGAGAYVKKPYVIEKLGMAVKKELDRNP